MNPVLTLIDEPAREAREAIEAGLARYNAERVGYADARPLAVLVSDPVTGRRFGEIACQPPGTSRIFLSKTL